MTLKVGPRRATLSLDGARAAGFDVVYEPALTLGQARELALTEPARELVAIGQVENARAGEALVSRVARETVEDLS